MTFCKNGMCLEDSINSVDSVNTVEPNLLLKSIKY
jgi:hypothetical protein